MGSQKIIPKVFFFFGHILPQHFCGWNNIFIVFPLHYNPSVTLSHATSLYTREAFSKAHIS